MDLVQKCRFFFNLFLKGNIVQRKVFYNILEGKNAFLGYKNKKFKRSKYYHYFKRVNPWFWSKNGHFSKFVFLSNISQENVFYDVLERKNAFLGYKKQDVEKVENLTFFKGG